MDLFHFFDQSGAAGALVVAADEAVVLNQEHTQNLNQNPNPSPPNVVAHVQSQSEYHIDNFFLTSSFCIGSFIKSNHIVSFVHIFVFVCFISCVLVDNFIFPFWYWQCFGLGTCLELSCLFTYKAHRSSCASLEKEFLCISLSFSLLYLNYNFTDQETAQSRNLSQSPNPDLVLGPRLRGQNPGRSPNQKPSLPQSESFSLNWMLHFRVFIVT